MGIRRKLVLGGIAVIPIVGGLVATQIVALGGTASAVKPPPVVVNCGGLTGTADFTNGSTQPGLTGQGETFVGATPVSKLNTSTVAITGSSPLTSSNCNYASGGSGGINVGAVGIAPIVTKAAKAYAIEQCSGFATATKSLKGLVVTLGNWTFKAKLGTALFFTNPPTALDTHGGDEVGFLLSGTATNPLIGATASDKHATVTAWLDPTFAAEVSTCIGDPGVYVGAITSASIDPGDSTASF